MVDAQGVQDRGVDVVDVEPVFDGMEAEVVGLADDDALFHAAAGHPHGESIGVMVAAVAFLGHGRAAELTAPDDQGLVEQAPALEVLEQAGDRLIHGAAGLGVVRLDVGVGVPLAARAAVDLNEPDAALDQAASQQAEPADGFGRRVVQAVEGARLGGLAGQVDGLGGLGLHAEGQLIALDPGVELGLVDVGIGDGGD